MAAISFDGVAKTFGRTGQESVALERIDLEVADREFVAIVGPSGCGKTTCLRMVAGFEFPSAGSVSVDRRRVTGPGPDRAVVFQQFALFPWKTVAANVGFGLQMAGAPRARIREQVERCLRLVGLEGAERRYPYQLSGGMQQRVGLARALAVDPDVLLMDEPFASVDAQTREVLQEELLQILARDRKTMVFITHSIDEAIILGDRVAVMTSHPGRVKEVLDVEFPRPRDPAWVRAQDGYTALRNYIWDELRPTLVDQQM